MFIEDYEMPETSDTLENQNEKFDGIKFRFEKILRKMRPKKKLRFFNLEKTKKKKQTTKKYSSLISTQSSIQVQNFYQIFIQIFFTFIKCALFIMYYPEIDNYYS